MSKIASEIDSQHTGVGLAPVSVRMRRSQPAAPGGRRIVVRYGTRWIYAVSALLFAFALLRFATDFKRLPFPLNDTTPIWVAAKAFQEGVAPYGDNAHIEKVWAQTGFRGAHGCARYDCVARLYPMAYPPSSLPAFALLALFPLGGLGLALAIKPQLVFLFMLYLCLRRLWKALAITAFTFAGPLALSWLWLSLHGVEVVTNYSEALREFLPPGGASSFYMQSPQRYSMVNLQVALFPLVGSPFRANLLAWCIFAVLLVTAGVLLHRRRGQPSDVIAFAIFSTLTLLPVYQQIYSASVLIFVVYWIAEAWDTRGARICALLMAPLLFPLAAMTWQVKTIAGWVAQHRLGTSTLWNGFMMPHVVWIEVALCLVLLWEARSGEPLLRESDERDIHLTTLAGADVHGG